jgi:hypothetical protein
VSDRYRILERIAVGGMGEVFVARQHGIGGFRRSVVIKRLLPTSEGDDDAHKRLFDEARVAAALSHENVVQVFEAGALEGAPFLAMEYVHGENLGTLRTRAAKAGADIPVLVAARVVLDTCRGLHHAHDAHDSTGKALNIVHRDVSPKNILVRDDGTAKVLDFGIAKSDDKQSRTATGAVAGTLAYLSPEQALSRAVGPQSDQFSLGIVLWELLTAKRLFKRDGPAATVERVVRAKVPRPSLVRDDVNAAVDAVVLRMLHKEPTKRFATLLEAAAALEGAVPGVETELGRSAVAAFVERFAGDELRARQERLRALGDGADDDEETRLLPQRLTLVEGASSSGPAGTSAASASPHASQASASQASASQTPHTRTNLAADAPTTLDRAMASVRGTATSAPRRRLQAAAAAVALLLVVVAAGVVLVREPPPPTPEERTRAFLAEARVTHPVIFREAFLSDATAQGIAEENADPVALRLVALMGERLQLVSGFWQKDAAAREVARADVARQERALEDRAQLALQGLGDDDNTDHVELRAQLLDMWAWDASAPLRWLEPPSAADAQADIKNGGIDFMKSTRDARQQSVDRLLRRAGVDAAGIHAVLDPLVNKREALLEELAQAPLSSLPSLNAQIDTVEERGRKLLQARLPSPFAEAVAATAFISAPNPGDWQPLHDTQPSSREERAQGDVLVGAGK